MSRFRVFGATMLAAALAVGAAAVPAAAVNGGAHLVIGHGIPSAVVDICLDDGIGEVEQKSNFRFGKYLKSTVPAGTWKYVTRVASPGNCEGAVLIKQTFVLQDGDDLSVILTKTNGKARYQVFDNLDVDSVGPTVVSVKHAAMLGKVDVYFSVLVNETLIPTDAPPTLEGMPKGVQFSVGFVPSDIQVGVAKTGQSKILKQTPYWELKPDQINHIVAIGGPRNFRFLRYRTPFPVL